MTRIWLKSPALALRESAVFINCSVTAAFQFNGAETWVSANVSQQVTSQLSVRFGVENATNRRVIYTAPINPLFQETSSPDGASMWV